MKSFFTLILSAFLLTSQLVKAQTAENWTLEKCIDYALKNNLQIRQSYVTAKMASADHLQSKLNVLPTIDVSGNFADNFGNGFNPETYSFAQGSSQALQLQLNGSVPLFMGLQQVYNVDRAKYDLLASQYDYETAQNNVALNVASAYLQILLNQEIEKVSEQQKAYSESQKATTQQRISAGALPEAAIYDIESQIGRDEVNVVNAKNSVELSKLALEQLLQIKEDPLFSIGTPDVKADNMADIASISSPAVYEYALNNQPVIKSADARVKSADFARKISYGTLSPTISAFGSLSTSYFSQDKKILGTSDYQFNDSILYMGQYYKFSLPVPGNVQYGNYSFFGDMQNNFRQVVGLSIDIPLFSRGQKFIGIQKAKLQLELRQLQLDASKNQLRQDIEQAYANAKAAAESYLANQKSLEAAQKAYNSTESRFKAGAASNYDMQQVKNNLIAAQSDMLRAKYTYVFRMKILDFYQGKPITLN